MQHDMSFHTNAFGVGELKRYVARSLYIGTLMEFRWKFLYSELWG
jgi:hypothetical protein